MVDARFGECEAVAIAVIEVVAAWAGFAVGFCHGVGCRIIVGPGDFCAGFYRDVYWAEGEVFNANRIGLDSLARCIIRGIFVHIHRIHIVAVVLVHCKIYAYCAKDDNGNDCYIDIRFFHGKLLFSYT